MPQPIRIDSLSATSLHITPKFNELTLASATAFTVEWDKAAYLITNWHVVTGRNADTDECLDTNKAVPNLLTVRFHTKGSPGYWTSVDVPLLDADQEKTWLEHPFGRTIDIIALPISAELASQISVYPLDLALAAVDMVAMPAFPVSVIGYPLGLSAGESWPIWKTGHIASDPDIDFEPGKPAFLIDATTKCGMSGSPVIMRLDNYKKSDGTHYLAGGMATKFMGIYAGRIHKNSEIGRVWRPFVLFEILEGRLIFDDVSRRVPPRRIQPCPCGREKRFKQCCGSLAG